jgi:diguanylate cyclase (GGDEF)-like protein/PAS domain S-box-containing protein
MYREVFANDIAGRASRPEFGWLIALYNSLVEPDGRVALARMLQRIPSELSGDICVVRSYGDEDFIYLQCGHEIVSATGTDMTGKVTKDFPHELGEFLREVFNWVLINAAPLLTIHRASYSMHVHLWERLIIPCRDWDGTDRLLVCIKPRELRATLLDAVLDASADMILATRVVRDAAGRIIDARIITANRRASEVTGMSIDELVDGHLRELVPGLTGEGSWERYARVAAKQQREVFEIDCDSFGTRAWLRITASPIAGGFMLSVADISDLKQALLAAEDAKCAAEVAKRAAEDAQVQLRHLSVTDALTGVLNRRGFSDAIRAQHARFLRFGTPVALVAVDVDHFKTVNDTHGHAAGDGVLMAIAAIFQEETRSDIDVIGRIGGEEFMLILPSTTTEGALALARRIQLRIREETFAFEGTAFRVTASFGVSGFAAFLEPEATMREADEALYEAKRLGRDRAVVRADMVEHRDQLRMAQ